MKTAFIISAALLLSACANRVKDFTAVSEGMSKEQVIQAIGEPERKNNIEVAELWVYPDYNKTIVFRSDTVLNIVNSSTAGIDSIKSSLKDFGQEVKETAKKVGKELDTVGQKLENRFEKDTTRKE